jgi:glycosyltransferase involved in cell wall biosynthesis
MSLAASAINGAERAPDGRLRVLLVCDWFLRYVAPYAIALRGHGVEVALLCRDHALEFEGSVEERDEVFDSLRRAGVKTFVMPGRVMSGRTIPEGLRVARAARHWSPSVVHAQSEIHDPRLLTAVVGYPMALTIHDPEPHWGGRRRPLRVRLLEWAWRTQAQLLIAHGDTLAASLDRAARPVAVVHHGSTVDPAPLPVPETPSVLLFGRLERYKGLTVLLEAMERVWAVRPEVRLIVAGKGTDAAAVPADPRVEAILNYIPEAQICGLFLRGSLAVLPYVDASQSGVGLHAVGHGVPVVVTSVGALPELTLDDSYVVPPGDPRALANALLEHLDDGPAVRQAVLEHARRRFSWDAVAEEAIAVLSDLAVRGVEKDLPLAGCEPTP